MFRIIRTSWRLPMAASLLALSAAASAQPMPPAAMGMGPGMGMGMHGPRFGGSPEHMGRMIDHMLDGLNATDAQRSQIKQIVGAAAADMKAQGGAARGMRQKAMQIFTAPTIDAGAAEQLRQQMLTQHDQMSRRMTQAMLEVARILTPEQRAKVAERLRDRQLRGDDRRQRMERERPMPPTPPAPPR